MRDGCSNADLCCLSNSRTDDPGMFATTSCTSESVLVAVRVSCPATLALYARLMAIIPLLLVDLQSL